MLSYRCTTPFLFLCFLSFLLRWLLVVLPLRLPPCSYRDGTGVQRDIATSARYFRMAADDGHARAMYCLALYLLRGEGGVGPDVLSANRWLFLAADLGLERARAKLNGLYAVESWSLGRHPAFPESASQVFLTVLLADERSLLGRLSPALWLRIFTFLLRRDFPENRTAIAFANFS